MDVRVVGLIFYSPSTQIIGLVQRQIWTAAMMSAPAVVQLLLLLPGCGDIDQIIATFT